MQRTPYRGVWVTVPADPDASRQPPSQPAPRGSAPQAYRPPNRKYYVGHPAEVNDPLDWLREEFADFQDRPDVGHPGALESFIPVYGAGRDAVAYLQEGDFPSAGVSALQATLDLAQVGTGTIAAGQAARAIGRGVPITRWTPTYNQTYRSLRKAGIHGGRAAGQEAHHTVPLNGQSRSVADWRNHPIWIKMLKQEQHRRLHGGWDGKKEYNALQKAWHGTTGGMKAAAATGAAAISRLIPRSEGDDQD